MDASVLIDTGAMLALVDEDDRWHSACVETFSHVRLPLLTSEAVLTEYFHLLGKNSRYLASAWRLVRSGAVTLASISDGDLPEINFLMERYADRPMDFADAALVHLAHRERISTVFTIDFADFQTYRIAGKRRFRIVPDATLRF